MRDADEDKSIEEISMRLSQKLHSGKGGSGSAEFIGDFSSCCFGTVKGGHQTRIVHRLLSDRWELSWVAWGWRGMIEIRHWLL